MAAPQLADPDWEPSFVDYVSFTNATAFSPTDTMPLTRLLSSQLRSRPNCAAAGPPSAIRIRMNERVADSRTSHHFHDVVRRAE
jgi:hypothetical protein